ncbi:MAG: DUF1330 domain-containing protein [Desulfobacteraceae bacterium]|jgi:uncharacterized protein (DUF1330 family)
MPAFVISEVEIIDEESANEYRKLAAIAIEKYNGRYLTRAAEAIVVEGQTTGRKVVILEFPSMQQIRNWYASPEYAKALKYRKVALDRRLMFVEGTSS